MTAVLDASVAQATPPLPIEVRGLGLTYAGSPEREVLAGLDFTVGTGELVCIVGPSGCGKTTLLRLLAGLARPTAGEVWVQGTPLRRPHPDVAVVFQDYGRALCPWRSVVRNVELPLEASGVSRRDRREQARVALARVQLSDHEQDLPRQLSGGMQQRVQIARALAQQPRILLMDEPFASLDALTRFRLEDTALELWRDLGQTMLLVTHDLDEAVYLADRIILLDSGPATVVGELLIDLPRPRDQAETRADPRFAELRHELFQRVRALEGEEDR